MSASQAALLGTLLALWGCGSPVSNLTSPSSPRSWEELHLSYARRLQHWRMSEGHATVDQPPADSFRVPAKVDRVQVPFLNSPSIAGETATVTFRIPSGSLPFAPQCGRILLRFDPSVNPFMEGATHTLVFLPDGRFWGGGSFEF
jgi:hypothetical protein